jgi:hypothetical protein
MLSFDERRTFVCKARSARAYSTGTENNSILRRRQDGKISYYTGEMDA